jgi:hypothetical protein
MKKGNRVGKGAKYGIFVSINRRCPPRREVPLNIYISFFTYSLKNMPAVVERRHPTFLEQTQDSLA